MHLLAQAQVPPGAIWLIIGVAVVLFFILFLGIILSSYFSLWIQSKLTGAEIGMFDLIGMTFRKVNARSIVRSKIMATRAGLIDPELTSRALEAHDLAGGNVQQVIRALVAAKKAKTISLSFREATAIDLAGRDVLESVQTSVYPKVIDCPPRGSAKPSLDAVAKDGIQLKVKARVTVRANLQQLIGGATEETIIARVGEGIVSAIGSAQSHKLVLANPDMISKAVLAKRLTRRLRLKSCRSISQTSTSGRILALDCKPTKPKQIPKWLVLLPKANVLQRLLKSKNGGED